MSMFYTIANSDKFDSFPPWDFLRRITLALRSLTLSKTRFKNLRTVQPLEPSRPFDPPIASAPGNQSSSLYSTTATMPLPPPLGPRATPTSFPPISGRTPQHETHISGAFSPQGITSILSAVAGLSQPSSFWNLQQALPILLKNLKCCVAGPTNYGIQQGESAPRLNNPSPPELLSGMQSLGMLAPPPDLMGLGNLSSGLQRPPPPRPPPLAASTLNYPAWGPPYASRPGPPNEFAKFGILPQAPSASHAGVQPFGTSSMMYSAPHLQHRGNFGAPPPPRPPAGPPPPSVSLVRVPSVPVRPNFFPFASPPAERAPFLNRGVGPIAPPTRPEMLGRPPNARPWMPHP